MTMLCRVAVLLALVVTHVCTTVSASHFLGAIFMVRPVPGCSLTNTSVEISYHISWVTFRPPGSSCTSSAVSDRRLVSGESSLSCLNGCLGATIITSLSFMCRNISTLDDWSFGERTLVYDFRPNRPGNNITIGFASCCWRSPFNSWYVATRLSLIRRNDTNEINSTPRATIEPVIRVRSGCNNRIVIPVSDPDDDIIHCRWAVGSECSSVCMNTGIPGAILDPTTCTITYQANRGIGYKAVAVMLEDFTPGSSQPLSSVALQFLVRVVNSTGPCPTLVPGAVIGFAKTSVTANEQDMSVILTVKGNLTGGIAIISISTEDHSAMAPGDYTGVSLNLTFTMSTTEYNITVPIHNDDVVEKTERFFINLELLYATTLVFVNPDQATVFITSEDELMIGFCPMDYSGFEGENVQLMVCVTPGMLSQAVYVRFRTVNGTAEAPDDYRSTACLLQYNTTNQNITVPVFLRSDHLSEGREMFFAELEVMTDCLNVVADPSRAVISIIDANFVTVGFQTTNVLVFEHQGPVVLVVQLTGAELKTTVQVQFSLSSSTPQVGKDYTPSNGTINFSPYILQQVINITIIDDESVEDNELFIVHLSGAPAHVTLSPSQASVTIIDNDGSTENSQPIVTAMAVVTGSTVIISLGVVILITLCFIILRHKCIGSSKTSFATAEEVNNSQVNNSPVYQEVMLQRIVTNTNSAYGIANLAAVDETVSQL